MDIEHAGCRVAVEDPADIVAAARAEPVRMQLAGALPPPVQRVRLAVAAGPPGTAPAFRLDARVQAYVPEPPRPRGSALGNDPLGVLLERRLAAGDPWAARIVDGLDTATEAYRRFVQSGGRPVETSERADPVTGLRATVSRSTDGAELRAMVPEAELTAEHVPALVRLALDVVAELAADDRALDGRALVLELTKPEAPEPPETPAAAPAGTERVRLDQVGGLDAIVGQFRQIAVSFRHPEVMARWGARRPQGILLYGPPGTGKTMLARALANEIGADFREVRTPEILDKWLGASERNIKRIFREARRYRQPTVLLFDEFDSIISYAGAGGDAASQAVNAVAGIFKQEMNDLFEDNPNIIVVATTNFPHRVDDSLIRSGRFDVKLSVPFPDEGGRAEIIGKMIGELAARHERGGFQMFAADLDTAELGRASHGMTGADLREVLRRAQLAKAMQEARTGTAVPPIGMADLMAEVDALRGGVRA